MKVIVTRSEPGGSKFAARLKGLGYDAVTLPLLQAEATHALAPDLNAIDAVIATSSHAVRFCDVPDALKSKPLYAVGQGTALEARDKGWRNVTDGPGNVRMLGTLLPTQKRLLHLCGEDLAAGTREALAPYNPIPWTVYRTVPTGAHERALEGYLSGNTKTIITVHSPKAAALLQTYVQAYKPRMQEGQIIFLCLSQAVLESLHTTPPATGMYATDAPTEDAMVETLSRLIS